METAVLIDPVHFFYKIRILPLKTNPVKNPTLNGPDPAGSGSPTLRNYIIFMWLQMQVEF
jgi:hypothetical protein